MVQFGKEGGKCVSGGSEMSLTEWKMIRECSQGFENVRRDSEMF